MYVFDSGYHDTLWDSHIHLVAYKHLHSYTLGYIVLKKKIEKNVQDPHMVYIANKWAITYVCDSGYHDTLWDSHKHLAHYKYLHSHTQGYNLLKRTRKNLSDIQILDNSQWIEKLRIDT